MREIKLKVFFKADGRIYEVLSIDFVNEEVSLWDEETSEGFEASFEDIELLQFAGFKDKNGVEIYTGYIVEYSAIVPSSDPKDGDIGVVKLEDGSFRIKPLEKNYTFLFPNGNIKDPSGFWTVIGNIYENPNLEIK